MNHSCNQNYLRHIASKDILVTSVSYGKGTRFEQNRRSCAKRDCNLQNRKTNRQHSEVALLCNRRVNRVRNAVNLFTF